MVTILHLADLHLDTPFAGLSHTDPHLATRLRDATLDALDAAVERALLLKTRGELDAVTFGGDIFDDRSPSLRARHHFSQALKRLCESGLRCFLIAGNHDPVDDAALWREQITLPEGATLFGEDWDLGFIERDGRQECAVVGRSYSRKRNDSSPLEGLDAVCRRRGDAPLLVGLLHGDIGSGRSEETGYAPVPLAALREAGCDAWLLGHIHKPGAPLCTAPWIGYPGNPQGRDINEEGARGGLLVKLQPGQPVQATHEVFGRIRWQRLSVAVDACANDTEVVSAVGEALEQAANDCEGLIARVTLTGRVSSPTLWRRLSDPGALREIADTIQQPESSPFVLVENLTAAVERPLLPRDQLLKAGYPIGAFLGLVDEARNNPESEAARAVLTALDAFTKASAGGKFGGWEKLGVSLDEVLDAAENVALGHLAGEGEMVGDEEDAS